MFRNLIKFYSRMKSTSEDVRLYRVSGNFMSVLQDLIPEVICSLKCHIDMSLILNSYGDTGI